MIFNAANILLLAGVFTGIGLLWPWSMFKQDRSFASLLLCFWIGWALSLAFLQVWQLAFPVTLPALLILLAAGALGWLRGRGLAAQVLRGWGLKQTLWLGGLALIPALMLANQVLFTSPNSDYALYHLQSVKWLATYRIVPGLGNLYNPLALNCSSFLYTAVINTGWLAGRAYYLSNTTPAFVLILQCANGFYALLMGRGGRRDGLGSADIFYALMIPVVLLYVSTTEVVGYSPDVIVFFLQIVLAGEVLRLLEDAPERERFTRRATTLVLLASAAFTVKLSLGVFGVLCLLPVVALAVRRYQAWPWRSPRLWGGWIALGLALTLVWMARSVVISGYPLFPSPVLGFAVPWAMPLKLVLDAEAVIKIWAATNNAAFPYTADWTWFSQWWNAFPFFVRQAFVIALGLLALNLALWAFIRRSIPQAGGPAVLAVISFISLVFWFNMAPSYRHSGALFWIFLVAQTLLTYRLVTAVGWVTRVDVAALALVLVMALWQSPNHFSNNLSRSLLLLPRSEPSLAAEKVPLSAYHQQVTDSGLEVNIPPDGIEECWNAPLPCTTKANFVPYLSTLRPGDLQSGFTRKH